MTKRKSATLIAPHEDTAAKPLFVAVSLETPITRGDTKISSVTVRKPGTPELRGLKLQDIIMSDVDAHVKLLPRITDLAVNEIAKIDPADLAELIGTVQLFFMTKAQKTKIEALMK